MKRQTSLRARAQTYEAAICRYHRSCPLSAGPDARGDGRGQPQPDSARAGGMLETLITGIESSRRLLGGAPEPQLTFATLAMPLCVVELSGAIMESMTEQLPFTHIRTSPSGVSPDCRRGWYRTSLVDKTATA
jgi:hypothetical protein